MYSVVHAPIPGSASSLARASPRSLARVERQLSARQRPGQAEQRAPARVRHRQPLGVCRGQRRGRGEQMRHAAERLLQAARRIRSPAVPRASRRRAARPAGRAPRGSRARPRRRAPARAVPGALRTSAPSSAVLAERLDHAERVGVEVEQRARALHRRGQVAQVLQPVPGVHVPLARAQLDDAAAVGQPQAAPVGAVVDLLDAGHRAQAEERDQPGRVQRRPIGEPQRQRAALRASDLRAARACAARAGSARTPPAPSR